jgi:formate hydrogenlyase subunit 3/multisubunit Na+/H+ antiporter MnhD subunit
MLIGLRPGGRWLQRLAFVTMTLGLVLALAIADAWSAVPGPLVYLLGGSSPPLGIALRADGPAVAMLLAVAGVVCGIGLFARADFGLPKGAKESRSAFAYWQLLAALGAAAIVVGSVVALRQQRLEMLVAYSTVAQIGYLFLLFPMAFDADGRMALAELAQTAGLLQSIAHATAEAGMFMAAGLVYAALGHDRIDDLAGAARALPVAAFLIGGLALMGVLPSGAYLAKKLLLPAAAESGQWWWTLVLQGGAAFAAAYVVLIALRTLRRPASAVASQPVPMLSQLAAPGLALASLGLSLVAVIGPLPAELIGNPLSTMEPGNTLAMFVLGALLAAGLARGPLLAPGAATHERPPRRHAAAQSAGGAARQCAHDLTHGGTPP